MKTTFLIITCLFSIISTASSQYYYGIVWEKSLTPDFGVPDEYYGSRMYFTCMDCLDKNNCIISGIVDKFPNIQDTPEPPYRRITVRTTDGGQTWQTGKLSADLEKKYGALGRNAQPYLWSLIMVDSLIAVAVGDSGKLIRSSDGGLTWERIHNATPQKTGAGFRSVIFTPDRSIGMAVGTYGIISITTDSGKTWDTKELWVYPTIYTKVVAPANNVFYIFDSFYGKMFRTFNAGKTWDTLTIYKYNITTAPVTADSDVQGSVYTTYFLSPAVGWISAKEKHKENTDAVDLYRVLAQTTDSGRTWVKRKIEFVGAEDWFNSIAFADADNGIVGGFGGLSLFSADGGFSWYEGQRFFPMNNPSVTMVQYKVPESGFAFLCERGLSLDYGGIYRFRRVPIMGVDEVQGWGSNPYFWVQTAPCPAVSTVRARLFGLYSIKTREVTAKVYDLMGNVVYDASREATDGNNGSWSDLTFSVEGWPPGVYLLGMQAEGAGFARAFVVGR